MPKKGKKTKNLAKKPEPKICKTSKPKKPEISKYKAIVDALEESITKKPELKNFEAPEELKKPEIFKPKALGDAPEERCFVLADGKELKNLFELIEELDIMSNEVFMHHVNEGRNDFSNWIRGIFEEEKLAEELMNVRDQKDTQLKILKHMVGLLR